MMPVDIPLDEATWPAARSRKTRFGPLRVRAFRHDSGVATLRISNEVGHLDVLPFDGQRIWDARFHGRTLTMKSTFDGPVPDTDYLGTNGAYFIHCGGSAMGNPGERDEHPLHGELPAARLQEVTLRLREIDGRPAVTLIGSVVHRRSFGAYFASRVSLTVRAGSGIMRSRVRVTNLSREPRPLMYLAHINMRPADGGTVVDDAAGVLARPVRTDVEVDVRGARELIVAPRPIDVNTLLRAGTRVEPELVQSFRAAPMPDGWVRSRQVHADGAQDLVAYRSPHLRHTVRWLRRSADDDAFGFALPASAEPDGFLAESAKGHVEMFGPGAALVATIDHGALRPEETHGASDG